MTVFNTGETRESLKAKYNPDGSTLRKAQLRMLEMLKFIDSVCKENNLTYYLDCGNLLGAVRHQGFIPWDDDADIAMPISDYKKFKKILLSEKYKKSDFVLQCHRTDRSYKWFYGVLRDKKSEYIQDSLIHNVRKYKGIQVDIFPFTWNSSILFSRICNKFIRLNDNKFTGKNPFISEIIYYFVKLCLIPLFSFIGFFILNRNNFSHCYSTPFLNERYEKNKIFPLSEIEFENYKFPCPKDLDYYLSQIYTFEYTNLPPETSRGGHDTKVIFLDDIK